MNLSNKTIALLISLAVVVLIAIIYFANALTFVEKHEVGFTFNKFTGEIKILKGSGWYYFSNPYEYAVHSIDKRPYQVSISANERILNAKLVRFNEKGLSTFIEWHGRDAGDDLSNLKEILKCYAFDRDEGRDCPFLTVVSTLAPSQSPINDSTGSK